MGNDWSNDSERARESDCHVAALLTSALLAGVRGTTSAGTTTATVEAAHAVKLYRCVLAALGAVDEKLEEALTSARTERAREQQA
jgi:hypothetical protein